jgi:ABC-type glutathione transport system ATPase component
MALTDVSAHYGKIAGRAQRRVTAAGPASAQARAAAVLKDIDFFVRPGECIGIVGESGSGKTTLGKCIVGLMPISSGEIRFRGTAVAGPGSVARLPRVNGVQMVYQDPYSALNPKRTVGSVLREILVVHKLATRSTAGERAAELLEAVGLSGDVMKRRPRSLSGGMSQRVAIARALAFRPAVLVADEVVSALDASVQAQVLNLIADTRETAGLSVVFITHDLAVINQVCDRVVVLHLGSIVETGTPAEILSRPSDPYTRSLIDAVPELAGDVWRP